MKLHLPRKLIRRLTRELSKAGSREIGGVLMGEALGSDEFRLVDLSVQRSGGDFACFVREPAAHLPFMEAFFERTGRQYTRFNYLGEWHSHPSFVPLPSTSDLSTMQSIVDDSQLGATLAVLLIPRLERGGGLTMSGTCFKPGNFPISVELVPPRLPDKFFRCEHLSRRMLRPFRPLTPSPSADEWGSCSHGR